MMNLSVDRVNVLGVGVNATSMDEAVRWLVEARQRGEHGYVCVTGAHGVMESQRDKELRRIHNRSLMTVPDGMPTVWMGREQGFVRMGRVYGPDLMLRLCEATAETVERETWNVGRVGEEHSTSNIQHLTNNKKCYSHFLYGSTEETLQKLKANLEERFPGIQIVGAYAPPFRPLTDAEEVALQQRVAACKPDFFWVGLSTPKQERFMAAHTPLAEGEPVDSCSVMVDRGSSTTNSQQLTTDSAAKRYPLEAGIMLGVGAAFDIHAGNIKDTPKWIQNAGLQWLHRLCKEPRRLWRRYLWIVPGFLWLAFLQLMGLKRFALESRGQKTAI